MNKLLLIPTTILFLTTLKAQEKDFNAQERAGLWFGFNTGFYFANRYNASFYNGNPNNENNINYIIGNKYHYEEIYKAVNAADTFILVALPERMKYDPAITLGFYVAIRNEKNTSFFAQFNYVKLKTNDAFTIEVDPATYLTFPDLRLYSIFGLEERTEVDLGLSKNYDWGENIEGYLEGGCNLSSTNVISNRIKIEHLEYSLINVYLNQTYIPNTALTEYRIKQGGIGYGLFAGGGIKLFFSNSISLDPGFNIYYKMINLKGYKNFRFHYNIFIRFTFQDILQ